MIYEGGVDCFVVSGLHEPTIHFRGTVDACQEFMERSSLEGSVLYVPMLIGQKKFIPLQTIFSPTKFTLNPKRRGTSR